MELLVLVLSKKMLILWPRLTGFQSQNITASTTLDIRNTQPNWSCKGIWQIGLSDRDKEIPAFVFPDGLCWYKIMPFGMKNSPATFQCLINVILTGLDDCLAIDNVIIHSNDHQLKTTRDFLDRLSNAKLTINRVKRELCHASSTFLDLIVRKWQVKPLDAKAISDFPVPTCKRQVMSFLGMAG